MRRMHKPDPQLGPDQQDKRSVIPIELEDVDDWLFGSAARATELLKLAPAEVFSASPEAAPAAASKRAAAPATAEPPAQRSLL